MNATNYTATDAEQLHAQSTSPPLDDDTPESFSLSLQEWNNFSNEFIQSPTYQPTAPMTKLFDCDIANITVQ